MREPDAFRRPTSASCALWPTRRAYVRMRSSCWRAPKRGVPGAFMPRNACGPLLRQRPRKQPHLARDKVEGECGPSPWWPALTSTNTSSMLLRFRGGIPSLRGLQQSSRRETLPARAPKRFLSACDSDPRTGLDAGERDTCEIEWRLIEWSAVEGSVDTECLAQPPRSRAETTWIGCSPPFSHDVDAIDRSKCPDQNGAADLGATDKIETQWMP
jgi:hypothetical protein